MILPPKKDNFMIVINCPSVKIVDQKSYDLIIDEIELATLRCPNCTSVGMHVHAYYERSFISFGLKMKMVIKRVVCPICYKTHALLLSVFVPYTRYDIKIYLKVIEREEDIESLLDLFEMSLDTLKRMRRNFKKRWSYVLESERLLIKDSALSLKCIKDLKRQFMQIHRQDCFSYILTT